MTISANVTTPPSLSPEPLSNSSMADSVGPVTRISAAAKQNGPLLIFVDESDSLFPRARALLGQHDTALLDQRLLKESLHELGHTLGLRHCADYQCVMSPSHAVERIDLKLAEFCAACATACASR